MRGLLYAWIGLLLCLAGASLQAKPLSAGTATQQLGNAELSYLRDPNGQHDINSITSPAAADRFQALNPSSSLGYTHDVIWLRLQLQREANAPSDWLLEVTNPYLNDVRLYSPQAAGYSVEQAGDQYPMVNRVVAYHHPVFRLHLQAETSNTFYLRLASDSTLSAQFIVWQAAALRDAGQRKLMLHGCMLGMVLMSMLISLIHWVNSRDPALLHFSGFSLIMLIFIPSQTGMLAQFVLPNNPWLADRMVPWTLAIAISAVNLLFFKPLNIVGDFARQARWLRAGAALSLLTILSREFDLYWLVGGPVLQLLFAGSLTLTGWISWQRWRQKLDGAGFILLAHLVLISSILTGRLMVLGLLPVNALTYFSWGPALLAFLLLVHAGIVIDVRVAWRNRSAANEEARVARELAACERQLRSEQTAFFSFVAHELRTPLGILVTGLKNLRRELLTADGKTQSRMARLLRAAERLGSMVERHLTLQRLASAEFEPMMNPTDPKLPALEALAETREAFPQRQFELVCNTDLPTEVVMDAELLSMALSNLLNNAAKYSPPETLVQITLSADVLLRYQVIDQGPGIAAQEQDTLFDLYRRSATAGAANGFGIGLATVKRVAAVHRGSLSYATLVAGGSIFSLALPLPAGTQKGLP